MASKDFLSQLLAASQPVEATEAATVRPVYY